MATFRLTTWHSGKKRTVTLITYASQAAMARAAERFRPQDHIAPNVAGVCQPRTSWDYSPRAGVVRLAPEGLDTETVAHEMTHMGMAIYNWDRPRKPLPKSDVGAFRYMANEETLAYIIGDLTAQALHKLNLHCPTCTC